MTFKETLVFLAVLPVWGKSLVTLLVVVVAALVIWALWFWQPPVPAPSAATAPPHAAPAGVVINSTGQMGGQVAQTIINHAPPRIEFAEPAQRALGAALKGYPPEAFEIEVNNGDIAARALGMQFEAALVAGGWGRRGFADSVFPQVVRGTTLTVPRRTAATEALAAALGASGLQPRVVESAQMAHVHLLIGER